MTLLQTYLVEDSPVIRESLIATLEELAPVHVVGFAEDESSAQQWLQAHPVDLVIVDLFLKGGSGLGLLRSAHAGPGQNALPGTSASTSTTVTTHAGWATPSGPRHVVLSNYATPAVRERCRELGADGVFDKSTEIDALIAYCQGLAQNKD